MTRTEKRFIAGDLPAKLKTLIAFRVALASLLLGSFTFFEIGQSAFVYSASIFDLIIALYALTIAYLILLPYWRGVSFAYFQLAVDVLAITALIALTGGIESWFSFLLLLIIIAAGIIIGGRAGFIIAVLSSISYGLLVDLQYWQILKLPYSLDLLEKDFFYNIFSNIMAQYVCAWLTGYLSMKLERTSKSLEEKTADLMELSLFNREVVENVPSGLLTAGEDGKVLFFNKAAEDITGISRADAFGRELSSIFPFLGSQFRDLGARTEGLVNAGGAEKAVGLTVSPMRNTSGMKTGYIGIFQDLTHIKGMQEEIKRKEKWAAIGELATNIAHEIRNPLASLRASMEMLRSSDLSPAQKEALTGIALSEMDRLNRIITDFLIYSRPTRPELQPAKLDLLAANVAAMLTNLSKKVKVTTESNGTVRVFADPHRLEQVLLNLGINAIESMPEGGSLAVTCLNEGGEARVIFKDTGNGIAPEVADKIFYPFFTTKASGTGLGLSIAMRIMEDHGGTIKVKSVPGQGSEFIVAMPSNKGNGMDQAAIKNGDPKN